jgi:hypothetical protein
MPSRGAGGTTAPAPGRPYKPQLVVAGLARQCEQTDLPILLDRNRSAFDRFEVDSIPVLVLIGKDGKVADYWLGMQYEKDLRAAIEKALGN